MDDYVVTTLFVIAGLIMSVPVWLLVIAATIATVTTIRERIWAWLHLAQKAKGGTNLAHVSTLNVDKPEKRV